LNELILVLIFLVVGFSAGILIGMLGIGGGVIFVPALYFLLPYSGVDETFIPYIAISVSLFAGAIASSFSGVFHLRLNNVDKKKAILFATGSGTVAFISALFVTGVHPEILRGIFAAVLFLIAIKMFLDSILNKQPVGRKKLNDNLLPFIGSSVGVLSSFTGLGGGIVFFPVLHYLYLLDTKKAVGTSSVITATTMIFGSLAFYLNSSNWTGGFNMSSIYLAVALPLGIGAVVGAKIGVGFVQKFSTAIVKKIFAMLLIIVVLKIILNLW
jgi:uncharacterized membrane protein YfcA